MTDQKSSEQRADARAQGDFDVADGKGHENANDAAEENCEPQHDEIDACAGSDDGANPRGRPLHDGLRADDAQQIAALQHDPGRDGDLLTAAAQLSQVQAPRPILARRVPEIRACKLRIDQEDIGGRDRDVEKILVLDLLGATVRPPRR